MSMDGHPNPMPSNPAATAGGSGDDFCDDFGGGSGDDFCNDPLFDVIAERVRAKGAEDRAVAAETEAQRLRTEMGRLEALVQSLQVHVAPADLLATL